MVKRILPPVIALVLSVHPAAQGQSPELTVMTFNIRYAHTTPPDLWPDRRPVVEALVKETRPDIIGTQEGLYPQLMDMEADLPEYDWVGLGREGGSRGEFMAVFYRRDRLTPLEYDHFWLSDSPAEIGSRSWGNRIPRMVTWVRFHDRRTDRLFYLVNTHLDHESQPAREKSAALILRRIRELDPSLPVIVTGDFNADAGANPVYDLLTAPDALVDTWRVARGAEPQIGTFHGFKGIDEAKKRKRIDWILTRGGVATLGSEILTFERNGQYPSDHFPVVARLRLTGNEPAARTPR